VTTRHPNSLDRGVLVVVRSALAAISSLPSLLWRRPDGSFLACPHPRPLFSHEIVDTRISKWHLGSGEVLKSIKPAVSKENVNKKKKSPETLPETQCISKKHCVKKAPKGGWDLRTLAWRRLASRTAV